MTLPVPRSPERLVYLGTPALAVPTLDALVAEGYDVALVVTGPDARRSRRGDLEPSPVKAAAFRHGLRVSHSVADVADVGADLGVVVAFGRIIPTAVLDAMPMVNLHFSLLPRWRGAAPVERALLAGDETTGVCVMDVAESLDEGDVYACAEIAIGTEATLESLRSELVEVGTELLTAGLRDGFGSPTPQLGEVTYAHKISQEDRRLDFTSDTRTVRRVVSLGDAWTTFRGKRLKVWSLGRVLEGGDRGRPGMLAAAGNGVGPSVATADGWLELVEVQAEGKPRMDATAWARGARPSTDDRLGA